MNDIAELFKLPPAERIRLAGDLWDSVAADPAGLPELSMAAKAELERRLALFDADPRLADDWQIVRARLWAAAG